MICNSNSNSAELAAMINSAASIMAKGKDVEEIEMLAIVFDMLSDTLFSIALLEKKREKLCEKKCERFRKDSDKEKT